MTGTVEQAVFSHHVSDESISSRKTSCAQQSCVTLCWHVLTCFEMRHKWLCAAHSIFGKSAEFFAARACKKIAEVAPLQIPSSSHAKMELIFTACHLFGPVDHHCTVQTPQYHFKRDHWCNLTNLQIWCEDQQGLWIKRVL